MTSPIGMIVACDNHYVVLLAALLRSIEHHHKSGEPLEMFIVDDGISKRNRQRLEASKGPGTTLTWIPMDEAVPEGMRIPFDRSSYPRNIHTRIFIPHFIPQRYEKIIYLDVDMVLMRDISELWNVDLGDHMMAAVMDPRLKVFSNEWGGVLNYKELGFAPDTKYFNTGPLVINTKKWREENSPETIVNCIRDNQKYANYPDQYGINIVMANRWVELDPRWNFFAGSKGEDPFLIHYTGRKPMYRTYDNRPEFLTIFLGHLENTAWKGFRPIGERSRYIKKVANILVKLPEAVHSLFAKN